MKSILSTLVLLTTVSISLTAQQIPEKTLLWRIEGKNLKEPSYMYGTMHLYDQRIFNFGDSVYKALEYSKGFANEVDPALLIDSMFSAIEADTSAHLRDLVSEKKYKEISGKLRKKLQVEEGALTRKKIASKRSAWYYSIRAKSDMDAIVDIYLYDAAKRLGKITGGIEDYGDQKDLFNEVGSAVDIEEFANEDQGSLKKKLEKFITIYLEQDIEAMYQLSSKDDTEEQAKKVLDNRNIKMASNIDSLSHLRSTFYAVGAAHLAGDNGLINLLRSKGFNVSPVYSSEKIHARNYKLKSVPVKWETISSDDSSYAFKMPGKANDLKFSEDMPAFKTYFDLANNLFYMVTALPVSSAATNADSALDVAIKRFWDGSKSNAISARKFVYNNNPAMQAFSKKDDIYFKMNMVLGKNQVYLLMAGAQKKETLLHQNIDSFFSSLEIIKEISSKTKDWHHFNNTELAIEIDFPVKPAIKNTELDAEAEKSWDAVTYSSTDFSTGGYYSLVALTASNDLSITEDSSLLKYKKTAFDEIGYKTTHEEFLTIKGFPAYRFKGKAKSEGIDIHYDILTINRINRNYAVMAFVTDTEKSVADAEKFIGSVKFIDFADAGWGVQHSTDSAAQTWGPSAVKRIFPEKRESGIENVSKEFDEYMEDKNSSMKYSINISGFSEYFSRPDEDSLLRELIAEYYTDTTAGHALNNFFGEKDSLIYLKKVRNGSANGIEIITSKKSLHNYKRVRLFLNGDSCYKLFSMGPLQFLQNDNTNKFFEDFRFTQPGKKTTLYASKSKALFAALLSGDSLKRENAKDYLGTAVFAKKDLPMLQQAFMESYVNDGETYLSIEKLLANKINDINDTSSAPEFVQSNYEKALTLPGGKAFYLLNILSNHQTSASYALLKKLWVTSPPVYDREYHWSYNLEDSLALTATLFPELQQLYADSGNGGVAIRAASTLLDSSVVSKDSLISNTGGLYQQAEWQLSKYAQKDYYNQGTYSLFTLLAAIGSKESFGLLNKFSQLPDPEVSFRAVSFLIEKKEPTDQQVINKLAATLSHRVALFNLLKKNGMENLFPKKYMNQLSLAESHLYDYAYESDLSVTKIEKLQVHKQETGDKKYMGTYYSFKVYDDSGEYYLGFAGPYTKDVLKADFENLRTEIYYDKPFSKSAVNAAFEEFIRELEAE